MHVLVYDPKSPMSEGDVVDVFRADHAAFNERAGRVYLPTLDIPHGSLSPWSKRSFGSSGIVFSNSPKFFGHVALHLSKAGSHVHWAALIEEYEHVGATELAQREGVQGTLRLVGDPHDPPFSPITISNEDANLQRFAGKGLPLGQAWILNGRTPCRVPQDVFASFALYGSTKGCVRLRWLAVSQAAQ